MFKRWKKIEEDFYKKNKETGEEVYDISKLPEICDNIKYDITHYPELRSDAKLETLLRLAQMMCMINVPFEYGITNHQKLRIGLKITYHLIDKIHHDLVWWSTLNKEATEFQDENQEWSKKGLNHSKLDPDNKIRNHWRHIRTRLYFTSASHMYSLLNVIKFGLKEPLNNNDKLYRSSE